ncbi:MAG: glycosyltransferase family 4 protein [Chitinophagaceae bacterium]|jgi:glycosyltransferase involved in cell wall biosynthesis
MNTKNTILIITNRVPFPLKDGGALAMYAMIKGWHDEGKKVFLLAMNTSRHSVLKSELPPIFNKIAGFEMTDVDTGIHVLPVVSNFIFSTKPQHAERFFNKKIANKITAAIHKVKPDIIQLESIYLQEYAPLIRQHSKALLIQRLHNIEGEVWKRLAAETANALKKFYLKNLAKRIAAYEELVWQDCDAIIPISNPDANAIKKSGCETPMITIPFGIEEAGFSKHPTDKWDAYHIGAMDWQPNVEAMEWMNAEIVPEIVKQNPDFTFQFAGRNMPERFEQNKEKSFFCAGEVADANAFIADKKILIVPLRSGSGIRIKTLEGMAAGKIVISTGVGIQGIEALDRIHFLKADTPEEFANAIHWISENKVLAEKIAQNAHELLQANHNQKKLMRKLSDFVEKLP